MRELAIGNLGQEFDLSYSENLSESIPLLEDDNTLLIINFDKELKEVERFATIINTEFGIFNFDILCDDSFDKVIGVSNYEVEELIERLINLIKPAHSNALVKFNKNFC
jgi:hypothetical protein